MKSVEERIKQLPPELQQEVEDFVQCLIERRARKSKGQLKLDWRGALRELRDQHTSVQLQHKVLEWWGD